MSSKTWWFIVLVACCLPFTFGSLHILLTASCKRVTADCVLRFACCMCVHCALRVIIRFLFASLLRLRWARELFSKLLAVKVYDHLCFSSVSSTATGALAPFRKSHVSLPTSLHPRQLSMRRAWTNLWDTALSDFGRCCAPHVAPKSLVKVQPTFTTILSCVDNDRVCSDFVCSLLKSGSFTSLLD